MGGTRKEVGAYLSLSLRGREVGWGWALIRGWPLIKIFLPSGRALIRGGRKFKVGRLFE